MSDNDIFNNQPNPNEITPETKESNSTDLFSDKLKQITNENGEPKYKDVESALEALNHSQQFIETLKAEKSQIEQTLANAQSELDKRKSVEDIVTELTGTPNPAPKDDQPKDGGLDEDKVRNLVKSALQEQNTQSVKQQNLAKVVQALSDKFGENASQTIAEKAKQLNTTPDNLKQLATDNPQLVLSLFEAASPASPGSITPSQIPPRSIPARELPRSEKSLLQGGATDRELGAVWKEIEAYTHQQLGITNT